MKHGTDGHYPTPPLSRERRILGHSVPRIEDLPLVTGQGRYAGDINFPHQLHMRMVRSGKAHGRIVSVDTSAALALPGVAMLVGKLWLGKGSGLRPQGSGRPRALRPPEP